MAEVQLSVDFTVTGGSGGGALTVTPSSNEFNLAVGVASDGTAVASVTGGQAPYSYELDATSDPMPAGVSFNEDGSGNITLAGTPNAAGTANVVLNITDSAGATTQFNARIGQNKVGQNKGRKIA